MFFLVLVSLAYSLSVAVGLVRFYRRFSEFITVTPVSKVATCFPGMFVVSPQRPAPGQAVVDVRRHAAVAMVEQCAAVVCLGRDGAGALPPPVHGLVPSAGVAMSVCTRSATASAGLGSIAAEASLW